MKILDIFLIFSFFFIFRAEENVFLSKFFTDVQITSRVLNIGNPSSALADNGLFISVWALHQTNPTESGIFGQLYNKDGSLNGGQVKISTSNYVLDSPSVTFENDGMILVVWTSQDQDGDGSGIYGQYLLLTEKIGSEFLINTYTVGDQKNPSVASSGGYFIVVWHGLDGSENGIFMKIYNGNGIAINKNDYLVNQNYLNDQSYPSIDMLISSGTSGKSIFFVITWMRPR